jgi:hypothetical protein
MQVYNHTSCAPNIVLFVLCSCRALHCSSYRNSLLMCFSILSPRRFDPALDERFVALARTQGRGCEVCRHQYYRDRCDFIEIVCGLVLH